MKAMAQGFPYEFSKAKKVVASVVAAALVISFGNFALGGGKAIADDGTVEVRFNITAPGATVTLSTGEEFTAESEKTTYQTPTNADLSFTAVADDGAELKVTHDAPEPVEPQVQTMGSKQPSDNLVIGEPSLEDGSKDNSNANEEVEPEPEAEPEAAQESSHESGSVVESETAAVEPDPAAFDQEMVEAIPETFKVLQQKAANGKEPIIVGQTDESEPAAEVVEDNATPMEATPLADTGAEDEVIETVVTPDENGAYVIPAGALAAAAKQNATIVVTIANADPEAAGAVSTWQEIVDALAEPGEATVVLSTSLTEPIIADSSVVVVGTKTLDLNGQHITTNLADSLFKVGSADESATLTITDSATKDASLVKEIPGESIPKPEEETVNSFRDAIGKTASIENGVLTYYVAESFRDKEQVGATEEYMIGYEIDMSTVGSIASVNETKDKPSSVVTLTNSASTLNIEAGRISASGGDAHAVNMNTGGTLTMTGGFITDSGTIGHGAAISANNQNSNAPIEIKIMGNAVVAGNHAAKNGGAIWVRSVANSPQAKITVSGEAVVAGNIAGKEPTKELAKGKLADSCNGGGIFADRNCAVTVKDNAVIAGNTANADGGGIYIAGRKDDATKSSLTVEGNAFITNNRSENDRSAVHPTNRAQENHPATDSKDFWQNYGGGGGGIFTLDETTINGGKITANFASDGGGGISAVGGLENYKYPVLKIENCLIASNYAGTSEGGGINAATLKESYIKQGYITNNMTATYYDYGGGGLFLSSADHGKTTGMTVYYPLVTNNTALGFGGGVALCTNGIVVSSEAAIYGNTALEKNATENPNEYGDQWLIEKNLHAEEKEGPAADDESRYGLKNKVLGQNLADDFFCAKESTVSNKMLGGGYYNWEGYTDGVAAAGRLDFKRVSWGNVTSTLGGELSSSNATKIGGNIVKNETAGTFTLHMFNEQSDRIHGMKHYVLQYENVLNSDNTALPATSGSALVTEVNESQDKASSFSGQTEHTLSVDLSQPYSFAKPSGVTLNHAFTRTETTKTDYPLHKIVKDSLLKDNRIMVHGDRLTFMTAHPSDDAKQKAEAKAVLFFNGNYSNTHGGGIACNDKIVIGANPEKPWVPQEPDPERTAALSITKEMTNFQSGAGTATAVFEIVGYESKNAMLLGLENRVVYRNTIGFTFDANGSATETLWNLPEGYYSVKEIYYSGDNFDPAQPNVWSGPVAYEPEDPNDQNSAAKPIALSPTFTNKGTSESFGTGVVNRYKQNDQGELSYTPMRPSTEEGR